MDTNSNPPRRWTDDRLDRLADSVSQLHEDVSELHVGISTLREEVSELRVDISTLREEVSELRVGLSETKEGLDSLRITAQALLQLAAQHQQAERQRQDEMKNINERLDVQQGQIKILLERLLST
jgi:uncharacterized coiled-coil DUF342 family protein